jgi:uncharacterized protein YoxC
MSQELDTKLEAVAHTLNSMQKEVDGLKLEMRDIKQLLKDILTTEIEQLMELKGIRANR